MKPLPDDAVQPLTVAAWRAWLAEHHATSTGVWLAMAKTDTGLPRIEYVESVEEALCWGWIDSVKRTHDDQISLQRFGPRKKGSGWARTNKDRLVRLEAEGRLQPAGRAVIEAAKADGSWTVLDGAEAGLVPAELTAALEGPGAAAGAARAFFEGLPPGEKKRIIGWLATAKTAPTRARRVASTITNCAAGRRFDQWTKETT